MPASLPTNELSSSIGSSAPSVAGLVHRTSEVIQRSGEGGTDGANDGAVHHHRKHLLVACVPAHRRIEDGEQDPGQITEQTSSIQTTTPAAVW